MHNLRLRFVCKSHSSILLDLAYKLKFFFGSVDWLFLFQGPVCTVHDGATLLVLSIHVIMHSVYVMCANRSTDLFQEFFTFHFV